MRSLIAVFLAAVMCSCGTDERTAFDWEKWAQASEYKSIDELLTSISGKFEEVAFYQTGGTGHRQYLIRIDSERELRIMSDRHGNTRAKPTIKPSSEWRWLDKERGELFYPRP